MTTTQDNRFYREPGAKLADGGPAFPHPDYLHTGDAGMSLRAYAAIKLRVPDSGIDWLDDMIRESMRDYFAAKAMPELRWDLDKDECARQSYAIADAMLKERG
ncbi:hypothetical protein [Burkholderia gladioli]|uniref:hypothetical protein n=1 Tax=Burkholderia gladioli TaxID=28095 RepID=UPI00163FFD31|nr:hypothetical protein [Burkholderia gladioli]